MTKLLICHWFGDRPEWFNVWASNIERLLPHGYDVLLDRDEDAFASRVESTFGIEFPRGDARKVCDYRATFGQLYAAEIDGYDFWGHTDLDCVYGRVWEWITDQLLDGLDILTNHVDYICGPWALYRNRPEVNGLFRKVRGWRKILEDRSTTGWVETSFTAAVDKAHDAGLIRRRYTDWQAKNLGDFSSLHWQGDRLMEGPTEVMMAHFRRTKVYPERCR